jgi:hypothetical protein
MLTFLNGGREYSICHNTKTNSSAGDLQLAPFASCRVHVQQHNIVSPCFYLLVIESVEADGAGVDLGHVCFCFSAEKQKVETNSEKQN